MSNKKIDKYIARSDLKDLSSSSFLIAKDHNRKFINQKLEEYQDYFNHIYDGIDNNIILDQEQRIAILTDEDYMMIIAGAGSGKTTTIAAKVKYLVDKIGINEQEILVLSYTNKAVNELKRIINDSFNIKAKVTTFHKLAYSYLKDEKIKLLASTNHIIDQYINYLINEKREVINTLLKFYNNYFSLSPLFLKLIENKKFKNLVLFYQSKKTLRGEYVINYQDSIIANLLYINNISYEYHYKLFRSHFIVDINKQKYYIYILKNNNIIDKINVNLLSDSSIIKIIIPSDIINNYEEIINEFKRYNLISNDITIEDCYQKIIKIDRKKYDQFVNFCDQFLKMLKNTKNKITIKEEYDERTIIFLKFIKNLSIYYQNYLETNNILDFDDLIIKAEQNITNISKPYKYIIVDEYQDISVSRFNFIKKLVDFNKAKLIVIGDDWQTIFSFAGSELNLFLKFKEQMTYAEELKITNTYRNSQELINIAGQFIMQNQKQIKKKLLSKKKKIYPVKIIIYNNFIDALKKVIDHIINEYGITKNILLLGRYQFDFRNVINNKYFERMADDKLKYKKNPKVAISYLTVHKAKGLGFDNVIIINGNKGIYGFPSLVKNDPIMSIIDNNNEQQSMEEERRLFYVSLTRSKNEVYILSEKQKVSPFIEEIKKYENVKVQIINKYSKYI